MEEPLVCDSSDDESEETAVRDNNYDKSVIEESAVSDSSYSESVIEESAVSDNNDEESVISESAVSDSNYEESVTEEPAVNDNNENLPRFLVLALKFQNSPVEELGNQWYSSFELNPEAAFRPIFELILQSANFRSGVPFGSREFDIMRFLNSAVDFNRELGTLDGKVIVEDVVLQQNIVTFYCTAFRMEVLTDEHFMGKLSRLLRILDESAWNGIRFTVAVHLCALLRAYANTYRLRMSMVLATPRLEERNIMEFKLRFTLKSITNIVVLCALDTDSRTRQLMQLSYWDVTPQTSSLFMRKPFIKTLVWGMYDTITAIRYAAVHFCRETIAKYDVPTVIVFAAHVTSIIVLRTYDEDDRVKRKALSTFNIIYRKYPSLVTETHIDKVSTLMFSGSDEVARQAGAVVATVVKSRGGLFINQFVDYIHSNMDKFNRRVDKVIDAVLPHASDLLTDWDTLISLLVEAAEGCEPNQLRVLNDLLLKVLHHILYFKDLPCDMYPKEMWPALNPSEKRELASKLKLQVEITKIFIKYCDIRSEYLKGRGNVMNCMFKIMSYFDVNSLDMERCLSTYMSLNLSSKLCIEAYYSTMAKLIYRMKLSEKWKHLVHVTEEHFLSAIGKKFAPTCSVLLKKKPQAGRTNTLLLKAEALAKYFDVTDTVFKYHAFEALQMGMDKQNEQVISTALQICSHIISRQVKNVVVVDYPKDKLKEYLDNLEKNVNTLVPLLINLMRLDNHQLEAYEVYAKIYLLLSPGGQFMVKFPNFNHPKATLIEIEWLAYILHKSAEGLHTVQDDKTHSINSKVLQIYCNLMTSCVIPIDYLPSVLPFFACYRKPWTHNFNNILQHTLGKLANIPTFSERLLKALAAYCSSNGLVKTEVVTKGLISLCFASKLSTSIRHCLFEFFDAGVHHVQSSRQYSFLSIMSLFVEHMSANDPIYLLLFMESVQFPDDQNVKNFLNQLKIRMQRSNVVHVERNDMED